jgi:hypothetical protein
LGLSSLPFLLAGGLALAAPPLANASARSFSDADDVAGKLDIRAVAHGHAGSKLTHTLTTFDRWRSSLLVDGSRVVFQIDTDGTWADDVERTVVIEWRDGSLAARIRNRSGRVIGTATVARPNGRTVAIALSKQAVGNAPGYRWRARATHRGVTDLAPVPPQLHDYTKPSIAMLDFPDPSSNASTTTSFDVDFEVGDVGFSELAGWAIERRVLGSGDWSTLAEGFEPGIKTESVDGEEGASYEFRVTAHDGDANVAQASRTITVPLNDTHPSFTSSYSSPEGTSWTFSFTDGEFSIFYLDTLHTNGFVGATFTYSFTGTHFAWVAPGSGGSATVVFDGGAPRSVTLPGIGQRHVVLTASLTPGPHTVVITSTGGTIGVDGIAVR